MDNGIIQTFDLSKVYKLRGQNKEINALEDVNLSIKKGEKFGLLGPNGAGKTTLIHILTTIKQPTSGYATIDGYNILTNPNQAKEKVALMLESSMLYYRITGYDNLKFFCKIYNVPNYKEKIYQIAEDFGLKKWLSQYVYNFSSGMKMKLALCRTFLLGREILFLDEPTLGLDVNTVSFIVDKIKNTSSTVFLTSHDMTVVESLCDRVAFINKGKILKIGTKDDIANLIQKEVKIEIEISNNKNKLKEQLKNQDYIKDIIENKKGITITLNNRENYKYLLSILQNFNIFRINEVQPSLKDLYIKIF
jgi:ABC-2 type transport system ATP-binding protein